jgi:hypothetical protein
MAKSLFIAAGHNGLRLVSEDGAAWTDRQTGKEGESYRAVAVGNGVGLAVGNYGGINLLAVTADGHSWKVQTHDARYVQFLRGLSFGNGLFLGLGGDPGAVGSSRPFVMLSEKGDRWEGPLDVPRQHILRRAAFGNGLFVAVGDRGRRAASADGKTWKDAAEVKAIDTLIDIAFGAGVFVGVGLHGLRMRSKDGLAWPERQVGEEGEHLNSVVWARDRFVAVGAGATYFSPDGVRWERQPNANAPLTAAYGAGKFVGAAWKGRLLVSDDAVKWREVLKADHHVEAVAWGELG